MYIRAYICIYEYIGIPEFDICHCLGPFPCALVGLFPTEPGDACSERSDEVRDCKLHITQTKDCT